MLKFLYEFFIEPFKDGEIADIVVGAFTWLIGLSIISIIIGSSCWLIDSTYLESKKSKGEIVGKIIEEGCSTTTYVQSGNVFIPITNDYPTEFYLKIKIGDNIGRMNIEYSDFYNVDISDKGLCQYKVGRLFGTLYIKNIAVEK